MSKKRRHNAQVEGAVIPPSPPTPPDSERDPEIEALAEQMAGLAPVDVTPADVTMVTITVAGVWAAGVKRAAGDLVLVSLEEAALLRARNQAE